MGRLRVLERRSGLRANGVEGAKLTREEGSSAGRSGVEGGSKKKSISAGEGSCKGATVSPCCC